MPTITAIDNGSGVLHVPCGVDGSIDYLTGEFHFLPGAVVSVSSPQYARQETGTRTVNHADGSTEIITDWRMVLTGYEQGIIGYRYPDAGAAVTASYFAADHEGTQASETTTLQALEFDLTLGYAERITRGSARFKLANSTFVDTAGQLYRDPSPDTGAGSLSGSLDALTGKVRLTSWAAGGTNAVTLQAMTTQVGSQPIDAVTFRTPASPLKPGTLQLRWSDLTGVRYSKLVGSTGKLEDGDCTIDVDYERGIVRANFGRWYAVEDLTEAQLAESWYSAERVVTLEEVEKIWKPRLISSETLVFNAVASTYLPPDSALLGLDAARLPPDGKALIFTRGDLVLTHHTGVLPVASLSAGQVIDCGRTRLYRVEIEDSQGVYLGADQYLLNRELGTVTLSANLDLTGTTGPYSIRHTVADLSRVTDTDINGTLTLMSPVSHAYPADDSYCSGVLFIGTLQARVSNLFAQSSWTSVWSDALIGTAPLAQYNDALYPLTVKNEGAYPDRILIRFTSATAFQVIGENLGLIGVGDINTDCEPLNALTGFPYFKIDLRGWGAGWAVGNCLRFNLHAASYPVDLVRAVQPSQPTGLSDGVQLLLVGNVDA